MNVWSPSHRFRSCARSLKRFGEALKRTARSSESRFDGFARARAHPPIPPRGVRSSDAPGFRSCARALERSAQAKTTIPRRWSPSRVSRHRVRRRKGAHSP